MKAPYLGKVSLFWCDTCHSPLLEKFTCNICHQPPRRVSITPPGDIRPAFQKDYEILQEVINRQYGSPIGTYLFAHNQIVLLNRTGGLDRVDEVILFGQKIGILQFNPLKSRYEFFTHLMGGKLIVHLQQELNLAPRKQILLNTDGIPFILDGKSILVPGVESFTEDIVKGDYVIISYLDSATNQKVCVATGLAQGNSLKFTQMMEGGRGQLAKNKKHAKHLNSETYRTLGQLLLKSPPSNSVSNETIISNLLKAYQSNEHYITQQITKAQKFIRETIQAIDKPIAVAYSGGKDSLGTLLLVYDAIGPNFKIFFADTGLELPEVLENIHDIASFLDMNEKLIIKSAGEKFWEIVDTFGPPGRDYRFCCHSLKAQNITAIIDELAQEDKLLVFLGQRQYESLNRSKSKMVYTNSFIPNQVAATPIKKWPSLLLWLTILHNPFDRIQQLGKTRPPITPLYFKGQERLGCYLCPASSLASLDLIKSSHPDLHAKWFNYLTKYAADHQLPAEWVNWGLWRYKQLPPQWQIVVKQQNLSLNFTQKDPSAPLQFHITKGFSPCIKDGYSIKGKFSEPLDLEQVTHYIPALAKNWTYDDELNVLSINGLWKHQKYRLNLYADGTMFFISPDKDFPTEKYLKYFIGVIFRAVYCNQCKTCVSICPQEAITLSETGVQIDGELCTQCLKCITHCPFFQTVKNLTLTDG